MNELIGKRALVTGGSRGIGAAIVLELAAKGADVAFSFQSRADRAADVVRQIEAHGRRGFAIQADNGNPADLKRLVEEAAVKLGGLDILVNNAGTARIGTISEISMEDIDLLLDTNVRGTILATQAAMTRLPEGGRIIIIGSNIAERVPFPQLTMYALTKSAQLALTRGLARELGPQNITVGGRATRVRQELKDTYGTTEEAKADISGLFALQFLVDKGVLDKALAETMYTTYLASMFRSIRFGINEAHGRGVAIQMNYFLDNGGVVANADGTFAVNPARIKENVSGLTRDIMTMQANGDYAAAKAMLEKMGVVRPPVQAVLDKLTNVPVDIAPRFVTAEQLTKQ